MDETEFFHVLNRGVDKRDVMMDDRDRVRFIHDFFVFNDQTFALHPAQPDRREESGARKLLVRIHAFCLMPNHFHLLLSPLIENGISLFMQKLGMGYAKYFNERYDRSGALWQGKYKRIHIERDEHFQYIPFYIHLNALDLAFREWRTGGVQEPRGAFDFLQSYRWSSHLDYSGTRNFPPITHREELAPLLGSKRRYEGEIVNIISDPDIAASSMSIE